jgi:hypothetical protein
MNLSEKIIFFRAPRGCHGPKLKIRKRPKKSSAPNFKNPKKNFLYVLKGPFQHVKDLRDHFLISESYITLTDFTLKCFKIMASKSGFI